MQAAASQALGLTSPMREDPKIHHPDIEVDPIGMSFDEEGDPEFHRYCRFLESGLSFHKRYPIKN
jgi:hypothetical protein